MSAPPLTIEVRCPGCDRLWFAYEHTADAPEDHFAAAVAGDLAGPSAVANCPCGMREKGSRGAVKIGERRGKLADLHRMRREARAAGEIGPPAKGARQVSLDIHEVRVSRRGVEIDGKRFPGCNAVVRDANGLVATKRTKPPKPPRPKVAGSSVPPGKQKER